MNFIIIIIIIIIITYHLFIQKKTNKWIIIMK